jgi:hypothetical protein
MQIRSSKHEIRVKFKWPNKKIQKADLFVPCFEILGFGFVSNFGIRISDSLERGMSRTILCLATALVLVTLSLGVMITRYRALGSEVLVPRGPGTWKVTLLVSGTSTEKAARLLTVTPLHFNRQQICQEYCHSDEFFDKPPAARHPERRQVLWTQRATVPSGPFRARYEFYCKLDVHRPTAPMNKLTKTLYAPPHPGEYLAGESRVECDHSEIAALARRLTAEHPDPADQVEALFQYVDQKIGKEPSLGGPGLTAAECLRNGRGDSAAKSRLLVALCRNRGIPARLVTGLTLARGKGQEQVAHYWVEAWLRDQWKPMCPFHHYDGHIPATYLVLGYGEVPIARGRNVRDLDYAFLAEQNHPLEEDASVDPSVARRFFKAISLDTLAPPEARLVEFLLLLPVAALIVCLFRNVIGLISFGTFAPALVGLAFRELESLPGIFVFVSIVLLGWGMRRVMDYYHLLQVPRSAFMLSLVVVTLITGIVAANFQDLPATKFIPLFPMVILTGMIERFWTLEVEDGTIASFKTLLATMVIAASISLILGLHALVDFMFHFPETLGLVMAAQLLLGRYTGYRLSELVRFRDFAISH